jgi:hypothetical protein
LYLKYRNPKKRSDGRVRKIISPTIIFKMRLNGIDFATVF